MSFKKLKKPSVFSALLGVALAIFLLLSALLSCSFVGTGDSVLYKSSEETKLVFATKQNSTRVQKIYVNVGSIYAKAGDDVSFAIYRHSAISGEPNTLFGERIIGVNYYDKRANSTAKNLAFSWLVFDAGDEKSVGSFRIVCPYDFDLNEVICTNKDGKILPLSISPSTTGYTEEEEKHFKNAYDTQILPSFSAKSTFSAEETRTMTAVHNILLEKGQEGRFYNLDGKFSPLSTLLYLPFVAIFGDCTGAVRICSALYTALSIFLLYLISSTLFKSQKLGLLSSVGFIFSGLPFSFGVQGAPYSIILSALLGGVYFMLRFYSKGISRKHPIRDGANVLYSGLCLAFALAIDLSSIFVVLGVGALFYFGLRRQKTAFLLAKDKYEGEETKKEESIYTRKKNLCFGFGLIGLFVGYFVFLLLSVLLPYGAIVRAYSDASKPSLGLFELLGKIIGGNFSAIPYEVSPLLFCLLPFKGTPFLQSKNYLFGAVFNPMLSLLGWASVFFLAYKTVILFLRKSFDKENLRTIRGTIFALGGLILLALQALISPYSSLAMGCAFSLCIPTLFTISEVRENERAQKILFISIPACLAVGFILLIPALFGFGGSFFLGLCGWLL